MRNASLENYPKHKSTTRFLFDIALDILVHNKGYIFKVETASVVHS